MRFVTAAGRTGFVRISVRPGIRTEPLLGLLGHELTHAAELARHPAVVDGVSLLALYERLGHSRGRNPRRFDTHAAIDAGRRVIIEMWSSARSAAPQNVVTNK